MQRNKRVAFGIALAALIAGGLIYIGARPMSLNMFKWAGIGEHTGWLMTLRSAFPNNTPEWVVFALPDALWSFAYTLAVSAVWEFDFRRGLLFISAIPLIGIISEFMQLAGWLPGVFDIHDVLAYAGGFLFGYLFSRLLKTA